MTRRLLLLATSVLASLLLVEVAVRLLDLDPDVGLIERGRFRLSANPRLGYEPVPELDYEGTELSYYDYRGRSNSLGYRDTEHALEKEPGTYRIVVLGDSIAAGLRVDDYADTFPAQVESELRAKGLPVEVLNFAVSGYNTQQEVETLRERALPYDPDLVLLAYCLNDDEQIDGRILATLRELEQGSGVGNLLTANPLLVHSALYRLVRFRLRPEPAPPPDAATVLQDSVAASFERLDRLSESESFDVLVVVFPRFRRLFRYRWWEQHETLAELSHRHGFAHLDLLETYHDCWPGKHELLSEDTWHPTRLGHACAAHAIAERVARLLPPPGPPSRAP